MLPLRDHNPTRARPLVTWSLIALNVAVFVLWQPGAFRGSMDPDSSTVAMEFLYRNALVPCELTNAEPLSPSLLSECEGGSPVAIDDPFFPGKDVLWSVVTSMFLHANWLHLLGNVFFLWLFGDNVEDRLRWWLFLPFYLLGGIVAALGHVVTGPESVQPVIGASGAVAAAMGAYIVLSPRARVTTVILPFFFLPFRVPAWVFLAQWFVVQFFTGAESGIAWAAHVAGFLAGVAMAVVLRPVWRPDPSRRPSPF